MDRRIIAIALATSSLSQALKASEPPMIADVIKVDDMKANMNFYQSKMHRTKKGGKVSFK